MAFGGYPSGETRALAYEESTMKVEIDSADLELLTEALRRAVTEPHYGHCHCGAGIDRARGLEIVQRLRALDSASRITLEG